MKRKKFDKKLKEGFSLMETMIWVSVIGIFGGLIAVGGVAFQNRVKVRAAGVEIGNFKMLLLDYYENEKKLPDNDEGLKALITNGYIQVNSKKVAANGILDPWNNVYIYTKHDTGVGFTIKSYGSDGKEGGESGTARDIEISEGIK